MACGTILIISGTNRPHSSALKLAKTLQSIYAAEKVNSCLLNLCDLPQELFLPQAYSRRPVQFEAIQRSMLQSAGLHIVTPEYTGSFPGILKYFIDMLEFPSSLDRRPVAFVGQSNGSWGGLRAVEQLQMVVGYRNAFCFPERVFIPRIREQFDESGNLRDSDLQARLVRQVKGFAMFVESISKIP